MAPFATGRVPLAHRIFAVTALFLLAFCTFANCKLEAQEFCGGVPKPLSPCFTYVCVNNEWKLQSTHPGASCLVGGQKGTCNRSGVCVANPVVDVRVNSADNNAPNLGNETTESETSVARHHSLIVVGYNTTRQAGLLGLASWNSLSGYAYSTDQGGSFIDGGFVPSGSFQLWGDPSVAFDSTGSLYYASLLEDPTNGNSFIGVNKSTSTYPTIVFGNPVRISGPSSTTGGFEDKEFLAVDQTGGPHNDRVYVAWSDLTSLFAKPQVMFAASSSNSPLAFSPSIQLAPSPNSIQTGAIPFVGSDGSVYVAWSTLSSISGPARATINLVKSTDGGNSFSNPDPTDTKATKTVASFTSTTTDISTGTMQVGANTVFPLRTRSLPYFAVDNTPGGSSTRGNIYCVFQAQPNSTGTPRSEIFFTSSSDGGKTWSAPLNITSGPAVTAGADPTNNDNWLPAIAVSPVTGHIKVLFYSRREDPANQKIRVYEAGSTDAGMTFYNRPFSSVAFTPSVGYDPLSQPNYMGDYLSAVADAFGLLGAWGDTRSVCTPTPGATAPCSPAGRGDQDVWSRFEPEFPTTSRLARTPERTHKRPNTAFHGASRETAQAGASFTPPNRQAFEMTVPLAPSETHDSIAKYLTAKKITVVQNDPRRGLISSGPLPLDHQQLLDAIPQEAYRLVPEQGDGLYYVTFKTSKAPTPGGPGRSQITIMVRILVKGNQDLDSPLRGRLAPSNGHIEQSFLSDLAARFNVH